MLFKNALPLLFCLLVAQVAIAAQPTLDDTTKTYAMPLLTRAPQGQVLLTWTQKDAQGIGSFCMAWSKDNGKTFAEPNVVFASAGLGGSRLMRPKIIIKNDGTLVAVFSNRKDVGGKRAIDILYSSSKDNGTTWATPQPVDSDQTACVRGFFDAVVLPNNEIAVAYLKDVPNSTKHEERDLRLVVSKNGAFLPEKIIDPVVCDCCNISLLVDGKGALNVYYRDNNDDVRDMAKMTSTDNATTFSKPEILYQDNWLIKGCPHTGAFSTTFGSNNLIAWFSGTENEKGLRVVTQAGKRLALINEPSAKNAYVTADTKTAVWLWEQNTTEGNGTQIGFQKMSGDKVAPTSWLKEATNATNANGLIVDNQLIVAYEVKNANKRNSIKISRVEL